MKRFRAIFVFLVFMLIFSAAVALNSFAEEVVAYGNLGEEVTYEILNSGSEETPVYTLRILGKGSFSGLDLSENALTYKTRAESVFSPYWENIVKVEVCEGIEEIGSYGLAFLSNVNEVYIPRSLTSIGSAAFQDCRVLSRIVLEGEEEHPGFNLKNITKISNYALSGCRQMKSISLSENLEGLLGKQCFAECRSLTSITIPKGISAIAEGCFKNCTALCYVEILGEPTIDSSALTGAACAYIIADNNSSVYGEVKEKNLPYGGSSPDEMPYAKSPDALDFGTAGERLYWEIKKHGEHTEASPKYEMIIKGDGTAINILDSSGKQINYKTYKNSQWASYLGGIVSVKIEAKITRIESGSFIGFGAMEALEIPHSLTFLGNTVFEHCERLEVIYLAESEPQSGVFDLSNITTFGAFCFDGCRLLKEIRFSENFAAESIGQETFKNCKSLTAFKVPAVVKSIGSKAFLGCERLEEVIFELDASIHDRAFEGCISLKTIRGFSNSEAESFANKNGIDFLYPLVVAVRYAGSKKLIENVEVIAGQCFEKTTFDGMACLLYTDPEGNEPYDLNTPINDTTTLYVRPIYRFSRFTVREGEKIGLRVQFSLGTPMGEELYSILECGAVASKNRGASGALICRGMSYTFDIPFYGEMAVEERGIELRGGKKLFTLCAIGFDDENGALYSDRCSEKLFFRGYIVVENKKSGEKYTLYTDMVSTSIYDAAKKEAHKKPDSKRINEIAALTDCEKAPITREGLLVLVEKGATDKNQILVSGNPVIDSPDFLSEFLADEYDKRGDVPALIRFNAGDIFSKGFADEENLRSLAKNLSEYASLGGSILLFLRPSNPLSENTTGGRLGDKDFQNIMTEGNPGHTLLCRELGKTGMLVQFLKEEGVTVFISLLPEIASEKYWWCAPSEKGGDTESVKTHYKELWKMCSEYMENDCSLNNIIWLYEGGDGGDEYYPGSNYVDIYGSVFESANGSLTLSMVQ